MLDHVGEVCLDQGYFLFAVSGGARDEEVGHRVLCLFGVVEIELGVGTSSRGKTVMKSWRSRVVKKYIDQHRPR